MAMTMLRAEGKGCLYKESDDAPCHRFRFEI